MKFNEYQEKCLKTARYPNIGNNYIYPVLGLCGESGEVAEKVKKIIRDNNGVISDDKRNEIVKELGDVLWYISMMSYELKISLEEVAKGNIEKLKSREQRNKLQGNGDNR